MPGGFDDTATIEAAVMNAYVEEVKHIRSNFGMFLSNGNKLKVCVVMSKALF